jgi:hypothetical protein
MGTMAGEAVGFLQQDITDLRCTLIFWGTVEVQVHATHPLLVRKGASRLRPMSGNPIESGPKVPDRQGKDLRSRFSWLSQTSAVITRKVREVRVSRELV